MRAPTRFNFGPHRLDVESGELVRPDGAVQLTPKTIALLRSLAERTGEVVTKEDLFADVWERRIVSDAALTSCIQELRKALQDDPRNPRFLETLHRRGYRLLVPLLPVVEPAKTLETARGPIVGRAAEQQLLSESLARARAGQRQILVIAGEPGIGKTTLLDAFISRHAGEDDLLCAHGQCVEHYGASEPYLPLLDAIGRLCRGPRAHLIVQALRRHAPMWLAQLPAVVPEEEREALQRQAVGATRERMLRELTDAVETLAATTPLILLLEDLHWSDGATIEWLGFVARHTDLARLLIVASARPIESLPRDHPVAALLADVVLRDHRKVLRLGALTAAEVGEYLAERLGGDPPHTAELATAIHARTEGNPLFVVSVTDDLVARGVLGFRDEACSLTGGAADIEQAIPEGLRQLIELQFARLEEHERTVLRSASAAGVTFCAATIAALLNEPPEAVEAVCASLVRRGQFLVAAGSENWPDGTLASRYAFRHALYRATLHDALPAGTAARLHARIGDRLEAAFRDRAHERASELATHFDLGRDTGRASIYHQLAGDNAIRRSAPREAIDHYRRALGLLREMPQTYQNTQREIEVSIALGAPLLATRGWGSEEARQIYLHAQDLCDRAGATRESFAALWGLWMYRWGHGELDVAHDVAQRLSGIAHRTEDVSLHLQAHHSLWATSLCRGELAACLEHAAAGSALYSSAHHSSMAARYGNHDAGSCALHFHAMALALRGERAHARAQYQAALRLAGEIEHPFSRAIALFFAAAAEQVLGEPLVAHGHAAVGVALAKEYGFTLLGAWISGVLGWTIARQGDPQEGVRRIQSAADTARGAGTEQFQSYLCGLLADACLTAGRLDDARAALARGVLAAQSTQERFFLAELYRLSAEVGLRAPLDEPTSPLDLFRRAIALAHEQTAHLLALRATLGLARVAGDRGEVRLQLERALSRFSDDGDSVDVREAHELLQSA